MSLFDSRAAEAVATGTCKVSVSLHKFLLLLLLFTSKGFVAVRPHQLMGKWYQLAALPEVSLLLICDISPLCSQQCGIWRVGNVSRPCSTAVLSGWLERTVPALSAGASEGWSESGLRIRAL